jgi:cell division transport system ATP-binding protein
MGIIVPDLSRCAASCASGWLRVWDGSHRQTMAISKKAPSRRAPRSDRRTLRAATDHQAGASDPFAVVVNNLTYAYPGSSEPALDSVSFKIATGEFVYLVGSSGSGKSSLLRILYAEVRPNAGYARVAGTNLVRLSGKRVPQLRRSLGVVFQDFKLLENRTAYEQVEFAATVLGRRKTAGADIAHALEVVGLAGKADRMPTEMSGGEQQRVAIARALVNNPAVLIADEPTGNLDPVTGAAVMEALERVNADGTTVIMATHDRHLVDETGHRVIVMADGKVVRDDAAGGYSALEGNEDL